MDDKKYLFESKQNKQKQDLTMNIFVKIKTTLFKILLARITTSQQHSKAYHRVLIKQRLILMNPTILIAFQFLFLRILISYLERTFTAIYHQPSEIFSRDTVQQSEKMNIDVPVTHKDTFSVHRLRELRQLVTECGEIPSDVSKHSIQLRVSV